MTLPCRLFSHANILSATSREVPLNFPRQVRVSIQEVALGIWEGNYKLVNVRDAVRSATRVVNRLYPTPGHLCRSCSGFVPISAVPWCLMLRSRTDARSGRGLPIGPAFVTPNEVGDHNNLQIRFWVDRQLRQVRRNIVPVDKLTTCLSALA